MIKSADDVLTITEGIIKAHGLLYEVDQVTNPRIDTYYDVGVALFDRMSAHIYIPFTRGEPIINYKYLITEDKVVSSSYALKLEKRLHAHHILFNDISNVEAGVVPFYFNSENKQTFESILNTSLSQFTKPVIKHLIKRIDKHLVPYYRVSLQYIDRIVKNKNFLYGVSGEIDYLVNQYLNYGSRTNISTLNQLKELDVMISNNASYASVHRHINFLISQFDKDHLKARSL